MPSHMTSSSELPAILGADNIIERDGVVWIRESVVSGLTNQDFDEFKKQFALLLNLDENKLLAGNAPGVMFGVSAAELNNDQTRQLLEGKRLSDFSSSIFDEPERDDPYDTVISLPTTNPKLLALQILFNSDMIEERPNGFFIPAEIFPKEVPGIAKETPLSHYAIAMRGQLEQSHLGGKEKYALIKMEGTHAEVATGKGTGLLLDTTLVDRIASMDYRERNAFSVHDLQQYIRNNTVIER